MSEQKHFLIKINKGTSLVVQWLRLCTSTARGTGLIPGQETKILHAGQPKKKKSEIQLSAVTEEQPTALQVSMCNSLLAGEHV